MALDSRLREALLGLRDLFGFATMSGGERIGVPRGHCAARLDPESIWHFRTVRSAIMRFIHLADVHLDTPFSSRSPEVRARLRTATREAFEAAVGLAIQEGVHAFLIAGDLFDGDRVSFETEAFVIGALDRLRGAGVQVVYASGNHDPGTPGNRAMHMAWPEGMVLVSDPSPRRVEVRDADGAPVGYVTAAGHASDRESEDLSARFPRPPSDLPEVALLHSQVVGSLDEAAHEPYAPSTLEGLRTAGYDYWALGHVHLCQELAAEPPIWYSGSMQGRTPREDGVRGCLLVDLSRRDRPSVTFRGLSPVQWVRLSVDGIEACRNLGDLVDVVSRAWSSDGQARAADPARTILHLTLAGPCPLWRLLAQREELDALGEAIVARLGLLWADAFAPRVHAVVELDEHTARPDVLGEVLRLVEAVESGAEPPPTPADHDLALSYVLGVPDPATYLAELLAGGQEDVLARLLQHGESGRGSVG